GQGSGIGVLQRQAAGERRNRPATGGKESPPQPPEVGAEGRWADNNERRLEDPVWKGGRRRAAVAPHPVVGSSQPHTVAGEKEDCGG
ncbi:Os11g0175800, partial [Oryza sativa Japonica Group]